MGKIMRKEEAQNAQSMGYLKPSEGPEQTLPHGPWKDPVLQTPPFYTPQLLEL